MHSLIAKLKDWWSTRQVLKYILGLSTDFDAIYFIKYDKLDPNNANIIKFPLKNDPNDK